MRYCMYLSNRRTHSWLCLSWRQLKFTCRIPQARPNSRLKYPFGHKCGTFSNGCKREIGLVLRYLPAGLNCTSASQLRPHANVWWCEITVPWSWVLDSSFQAYMMYIILVHVCICVQTAVTLGRCSWRVLYCNCTYTHTYFSVEKFMFLSARNCVLVFFFVCIFFVGAVLLCLNVCVEPWPVVEIILLYIYIYIYIYI